jgi:hypothetical protein
MFSKLELSNQASASLVRPRGCADLFVPKGEWVVKHWRFGRCIATYRFPNAISAEGKTALLNVMFGATAKITAWYVGLIDATKGAAFAAGTPNLAVTTDTYAAINQAGNGWSEYAGYSDTSDTTFPGGTGLAAATARPLWTPGTPVVAGSAVSVQNTATSNVQLTAAGIVAGLFVVGGGTQPQKQTDHAAGSTLWSTAAFTNGNVTVANGDTLQMTYSVGC